MCGLVCVVSLDGSPIDPETVRRMNRSMVHRGPDDEGYYADGAVALGFRRLAILDLSETGHQPMLSEDGGTVIVFNGEIYNYVELREELRCLGHRFRSTGDTEVLLNAYRQWGRDCLHRLSGMWSFIVYDVRSRTIFGSRDRFGIKPLHVARHGNLILLASEIKGIRAALGKRPEPNWTVVADFLVEGRLDESHDTFFAGVRRVAPATAFELAPNGRWTEWIYWKLPEEPCRDVVMPVADFLAKFRRSVELHLRSDVPIGVQLSGGLDSTAILCTAADHGGIAPRGLQAFCFFSPEHDERRFVRSVVDQTGTAVEPLTETPQQLWKMVPELLYYQDEPVHSMTALIGYALNRSMKMKGIKVALNGQGSDETLAGYGSYFVDYWRELLIGGRFAAAIKEITAYAKGHGHDARRLVWQHVSWLLTRPVAALPGYAWMSAMRQRKRQDALGWFEKEFVDRTTKFLPAPRSLHESLRSSVSQSPLPLYLRVEDRNSMAHSVEARVPFLDHTLVQLAFSLPAEWKVRGLWNKHVLRESMRGILPEPVRTRLDKMGFPAPVDTWCSGPLFTPIMDILTSRSFLECGIYDAPRILRDAEQFRSNKALGIGSKLFDLAQFELWRRDAGQHSAVGRDSASNGAKSFDREIGASI